MFYLTTHSTHFYLRLYCIRHMVKDHSAREETRCHHIVYSFRLARFFLYASSHRHDNTYHGIYVTPVVEHWLEREIPRVGGVTNREDDLYSLFYEWWISRGYLCKLLMRLPRRNVQLTLGSHLNVSTVSVV